MKKIFLLSFLLLVTVSLSAEVYPTVDDDVGVELVSSVESQTTVAIAMTIENYDVKSVQFPLAGTMVKQFEIDNLFYVSDYSLNDIGLRASYLYKHINKIEKPPLETLLNLSSCSLADRQVSLRA